MTRIEKVFAISVCLCSALTMFTFWALFLSGPSEPPVIHSKNDRTDELPVTEETFVEETIEEIPETFEEIPEAVEPEVLSLGTFKLTAYCACAKCCGEWADGITYTGTVATPGRTVAVDPAVIPLGSTVYVNGQAYVAEDIGGAIKGNRIDVFFASHTEALHFGVQYAEVTMPQNNP